MTEPTGPLVDVALPLPTSQHFTYALPSGLKPPPAGSRVLVPFGRQIRIGWVVGQASAAPPGLKPIVSVLDREPSATPAILSLCRWVSSYYFAPLGLVIRSALPTLLSDASRDYLRLIADASPGDLPPKEERIVQALLASAGPRHVQTLAKELGMRSIWPHVRRLVADGVVTHDVLPPRQARPRTHRVVRLLKDLPDLSEREVMFRRAPRQREAFQWIEASGGRADLAVLLKRGFSRAVVNGLVRRGVAGIDVEARVRDPFASVRPDRRRPKPTPAQHRALERLKAALEAGRPNPFLLFGVTGSGKTLVYLEVIEAALARGRGAVVLVPEISLTPQAVARFRGRFGDQVAVLHSGLSDGERYDAWRELRSGRRRIALGARSAIFAPVADLGVIVVDEEHDASYKQSDAPRYHARDLAVMRARTEGALCILGTATPSLESWQNCRSAKYERLDLPDRATGAPLPPVQLIDLKRFRRSGVDSNDRPSQKGVAGEGGMVLSPPLAEAIEHRLSRSEQVILLLNRRGYSSFVQCLDCGDVTPCPDCAVSLTYHRTARRLMCHHCGYVEPLPPRCGACGSTERSFQGLGTEQVERVVAMEFPTARIARMDVDTTSGKWSHRDILGRVERGEVDILMGTQMIAKGLDFPRVTLVGVVNADVGLHLPDFRATERTVQLLSQVAGRAGRGALGGEVLIQTRVPDHFAMRAVVDHDYPSFADRELDRRRTPRYPPHVRMVNVLFSSPEPSDAADAADAAADWVRNRGAVEHGMLTGPSRAPIERLHGRWRWHFLLRSSSAAALGSVGQALQREVTPPSDVRMILDRDPVALL